MGLLDNIKDAVGMSDEDKARRAEEEAKKAEVEAEAARKKADGTVVAEGQAPVDDAVVTEGNATPAPAPAPAPKPAPPADAAPKPAPAPAPAPAAETYTVKEGDTLSEIGQQLGVPWRKIAEANNVENPDLIFPGQVFKIPR